MSCIDTDERPFVNVGVITPCHARYAPPDASVAAIKTERNAARPIDMSECGEKGSMTSPVDIFGGNCAEADGAAL